MVNVGLVLRINFVFQTFLYSRHVIFHNNRSHSTLILLLYVLDRAILPLSSHHSKLASRLSVLTVAPAARERIATHEARPTPPRRKFM